MPPLVLIVPGPLDARTGGTIYDRRMAAGLAERGWSVDVRELDGSFPHPSADDVRHAVRVLAQIPDGTTMLVDGLAFGAMPEAAEREAERLRFVALVHLPLAAEIGLDREIAARLVASERRALTAARLAVVTGQRTVDTLVGYGVKRDHIAVVEPGADRAPLARGSQGAHLNLLSVATLNPGKGHEILFRALAMLPHHNWRLTCAGNAERYPATAERLGAVLHALDMENRVTLVGEVDDAGLAACYDGADLFVLATLHETYGMAVAEALAHGLAVVSTATGAIVDLVGPGNDAAGILVPPGDVKSFADALSLVLADSRLREQLADGARQARERLAPWDAAFTKMSAALKRVAIDG